MGGSDSGKVAIEGPIKAAFEAGFRSGVHWCDTYRDDIEESEAIDCEYFSWGAVVIERYGEGIFKPLDGRGDDC